ncbi:MAG: choice-of-anchor L domain-containing protein [Saprospiraceae bacterium]|nr:choice-of-anchor L domain-containing protein [Saprospiraceae bacterium]
MLHLSLFLSLFVSDPGIFQTSNGPAVFNLEFETQRFLLDGETSSFQICDLSPAHEYVVQLADGQNGQTLGYVFQEANQSSTGTISGTTCAYFTVENPFNSNMKWVSIQCMDCAQEIMSSNLVSPIIIEINDPIFLVENYLLSGNCAEVSNISFAGSSASLGGFFGGEPALGIESGFLMSTGIASSAAGPNVMEGTSTVIGGIFDPDLAVLASTSATFDVQVLEFDIIPHADHLSFEFVFASEEYCEYIFSIFEDMFGLFISGPGINGPFTNGAVNLALTPENQNPISVNYINHQLEFNDYVSNAIMLFDPDCAGSEYGTDPGLSDISFDGFTLPLLAEIQLIPCESYHVKLAIADTGDATLDSGVFIRQLVDSPASDDLIYSEVIVPESGTDTVFENCQQAFFQFIRVNSNLNDSLVFYLEPNSTSTATEGLDYQFLPDSLTFPAGVDTLLLEVEVFSDLLTEPVESLILSYDYSCTCDSLILYIEDHGSIAITVDTVLCWPDCLELNNSAYCTDGIYPDTSFNVTSCDTIFNFNLTVIQADSVNLEMELCQGDSVEFNGQFLTEGGIYFDTLFGSAPSCNKLIQLDLSFLAPVLQYDTVFLCPGDSLLFGGTYLTQSGDYTDTIDVGGCQGINFLNLTFGEYQQQDIQLNVCPGQSITYNGNLYGSPGIYLDTLFSTIDCDTILEISIVENPTYFFVLDTTICSGDFYLSPSGNVYSDIGQYIEQFQTVSGCDSIYEINLELWPAQSDTLLMDLCFGDSILVGSNWVSQPGIYPADTLQSVANCDSILYYDISLQSIIQLDSTFHFCLGDSLLIGDSLILSEGIYELILPGIGACDTIFTAIVVWDLPQYTFQFFEICTGDSVQVGNQVYTETGIYQDVFSGINSCDSIVETQLVVYQSSTQELVLSLCEGYGGVMIGDTIYTESGIYTDTLSSENGCDSIIQLNLSFAPGYEFIIDTTLCADLVFEYFGELFPEPGVYTIPYISSQGCDSIYIITLDYIELDDPTFIVEPDNGNGTGSVFAMASGGIAPYSFEWSNGESGALQEELAAGIYLVTITDSFGCTIIEAVEVPLFNAITDPVQTSYWGLSPNPGNLITPARLFYSGDQVITSVQVNVYAISGKLVSSGLLSGPEFSIPNPGVAGLYIIRLEANAHAIYLKWLVL